VNGPQTADGIVESREDLFNIYVGEEWCMTEKHVLAAIEGVPKTFYEK